MPQISIIIPVFNAERFLRPCLDSISNQTYSDWECILVDDGSTDCSGAICDEYATIDNRYKVFHKTNGGVSSARNFGIDKANGEWLFFSDADDFIDPIALELFNSFTKGCVDMVWGGFSRFDIDGNCIERAEYEESRQISVIDAITYIYHPHIYKYNGYLWNKLFKRTIIRSNSLSFDNHITYNEDSLFIIKYLCVISNPIWFTTQNVYNYILRESGAMASLRKSPSKRFSSLIAYHDQYLTIASSPYCRQCSKLALESCWVTYKFLLEEMRQVGSFSTTLKKELTFLYIRLLGPINYCLNRAIDYKQRILKQLRCIKR